MEELRLKDRIAPRVSHAETHALPRTRYAICRLGSEMAGISRITPTEGMTATIGRGCCVRNRVNLSLIGAYISVFYK